MTTTVRVLRPFHVHHQGQVYGPGETLDVDDRAAAGWAAFGSVTAVEKRQPKPKSSSSKKAAAK